MTADRAAPDTDASISTMPPPHRCAPRRSRPCCPISRGVSATHREATPSHGGPGWPSMTPASRSPTCSAPISERWCSPASGTEADNLAVAGSWEAGAHTTTEPAVLVCAAMEHHAVLHACRALAARTGADLREVPTDKDGIVDLDALAAACGPEVSLVSVMAVNNEIGTVQPIDAVATLVRSGCARAVLHTDAVQAVPWLDVAVADRARRPGGGQRPQVRRPQGRGRARRPARDRRLPGDPRRRARSGSAGAAPTTWPASWPWPRPCQPPCRNGTRRWLG